MGDHKYASGQLVRLRIENRTYTEEGFATIGTFGVPDISSGMIYSRVCLSSFPSWNDFYGDSTIVSDGTIATIVSFKGRPIQICSSLTWEKYDIYEVLVDSVVRSVFSYNLEVHGDYFKKSWPPE